MCGTCGCGTGENGAVIIHPLESKNLRHMGPGHHEHAHEHPHPHGHVHGHAHDHGQGHTHVHPHKTLLEVEQDVLQQNEIHAARNRGYFEARGIIALNLVSSPGSGKTALLERTLRDMKNQVPFYVIEGDQQTTNDAQRIAALDVPVVQINTGKGCHLESDMVYEAVRKLDIKQNGVLMIENVGNLVCPSMFDLGESKRVVIISTTEGVDKPLKYPDMFHTSDICIINKVDLLPYLELDLEELKQNALRINPRLEFFELSATKGKGMQGWYQWLKAHIGQSTPETPNIQS